MRLARAILSLSTLVITLAGVSAFSAPPAETSSAEPTLPVAVPTNGERCLGADAGPEVDTAMGAETTLQAEAVLAALDDSRFAACSDPVEAVTKVACAQPVQGRPFPSPAPEKFLCADKFNDTCFAGCCGPRGQINKWAACCTDPCDPDCGTVCQRYCGTGPR